MTLAFLKHSHCATEIDDRQERYEHCAEIFLRLRAEKLSGWIGFPTLVRERERKWQYWIWLNVLGLVIVAGSSESLSGHNFSSKELPSNVWPCSITRALLRTALRGNNCQSLSSVCRLWQGCLKVVVMWTWSFVWVYFVYKIFIIRSPPILNFWGWYW